ncbi:MAG: 3-deoxy-7-phosphoheptulonate synthase [Chlamydiota bacterium]
MSRDNRKKMRKKELPSPKELKKEIQSHPSHLEFIQKTRSDLNAILSGNDSRTVLIVGPCSIHDVASAKDYAVKLKKFSEEVSDKFLIIMRVYFAKPRTTTGWKGILYDPYVDTSHDVENGIRWTRQLLVDLAEMKIPIAAEILDPLTAHYFSDLITWGCIGARTAESQIHREIASGLPMPIGFKNNTDGNAQIAVDGAYCASTPHTFIAINDEGKLCSIVTEGNKNCHIVLRGGVETTNYDPHSILKTTKKLEEAGINKKLIIDCSHDNSKQGHDEQIVVFQSVIHQIIEGNKSIAGLILESHLIAGRQEIPFEGLDTEIEYGKSITDPCLDWETTKKLIQWGYDRMNKENEIRGKEFLSTKHASSCLSN